MRRLAVRVQCPVAGSYSSALACTPVPSAESPPTTSTRPSRSRVAVNEIRPTFILPVAVHVFAAGSYSSASELYRAPPATSTCPSARRTATCPQWVSFSVPPGSHAPVGGSYSSVLSSSRPPTTRTRPFSSGVAVRLSRGTDILAVAAQLPASIPLDAASGVTVIASTAQIADAATFVLTTKPPPLLDERRLA